MNKLEEAKIQIEANIIKLHNLSKAYVTIFQEDMASELKDIANEIWEGLDDGRSYR